MGFLGRALGRRMRQALDEAAQKPEVKLAVERSRRQMALVQAVREVAGRPLDDGAACSEVREWLSEEDLDLAVGAIEHLGGLRTGYLDDRAYRLLTAVVEHAPVRPVDPAVRDQFLQEERLGRMPLSDAFAHLAALEPRLLELPEARRRELARPKKNGWSIGRSEPPLVGPWAGSPHVILNTPLAADVVQEYVHAISHGRRPDEDSTAFFQLKRHTFGGSVALFGRGDTRPRARN